MHFLDRQVKSQLIQHAKILNVYRGGQWKQPRSLRRLLVTSSIKSALGRLWVDRLGLTRTGTFRSERENVDEDILAIAGVEIDLMQPIDPAAKPRVHEPRLNHIGLWVDDLAAAASWLRGATYVNPEELAALERGAEPVEAPPTEEWVPA